MGAGHVSRGRERGRGRRGSAQLPRGPPPWRRTAALGPSSITDDGREGRRGLPGKLVTRTAPTAPCLARAHTPAPRGEQGSRTHHGTVHRARRVEQPSSGGGGGLLPHHQELSADRAHCGMCEACCGRRLLHLPLPTPLSPDPWSSDVAQSPPPSATLFPIRDT